ncbi:hypothetical protein Zmor_007974 [Zophobas morio]|uniref:Uncharacterized protein n=1 Tax=Zophobas morio TaxID=2755281 RepID=A0AA38J1B1_9CUCU|nr:hypothetical protein Zmor_007974 [Zophobas morio]
MDLSRSDWLAAGQIYLVLTACWFGKYFRHGTARRACETLQIFVLDRVTGNYAAFLKRSRDGSGGLRHDLGGRDGSIIRWNVATHMALTGGIYEGMISDFSKI